MKHFLYLASFSLFLSSCVSYQYSTLSSQSTTLDSANKVFYYENNSLKITYNFYEVLGTINMTIKNKKAEGLTVDWSKSSLIANGKAYNFFNRNLQLSGSFSGSSYKSIWGTSSSGTISGTVMQGQERSFLPPKTEAVMRLSFNHEMEYKVDDKLWRDSAIINMPGTNYPRPIKVANFTSDISPLKVSIYLAIKTENSSAEQAITKEFFVSEAVRTAINPNNFLPFKSEIGNMSWHMK